MMTGGYVPPNAIYKNKDAAKWLGSPAATEALFVKNGFNAIPDNYLSIFEEWLYSNSFLQDYHHFTHIIYCKATLCEDRQFIVLEKIFTRPCAEHCGFAHLVLLQILRYCHLYNLDLIIDEPTTDTVEGLLKFLPSSIVYERAFSNNRVIDVFIPVRYMAKLCGQVKARLVGKGLLDGIQDDSQDLASVPPMLHLWPSQFPTAYQLCYGPNGSNDDRDMLPVSD